MEIITRDGRTYAPKLLGEPSLSYQDGHGFLQATAPCVVPDADVRGALVRLDTAVPWWGVITEQPAQGDTLAAVGFGIVGTWQRREAPYCDTDLGTWEASSIDPYVPSGWTAGTDEDGLNVTIEAGTYAALTKVLYNKAIPTTAGVRISGTLAIDTSSIDLLIYTSGTRGSLGTLRDTITASGDFTVDVSAAGIRQVSVMVRVDAGGYSPASTHVVTVVNLAVYGVSGVTTTNPTTVLTDILANEIDPYYYPAGRNGFIASDTTALTSLVYASSNANPKIDELQTYSSHRFGWYSEKVAGMWVPCPHWEPRPSLPAYIVDMADSIDSDMQPGSFGDLASAIDVTWTDPKGRAQVTRVYDTDASHLLVKLGMNTATTAIVREVSAQVRTSAGATSIGELALTQYGADQMRGTGTWAVVRDANGVRLPASAVRPNKLALVYGDTPQVVMVRETEALGDASVRLTLDNASDRLDVALARVDMRYR